MGFQGFVGVVVERRRSVPISAVQGAKACPRPVPALAVFLGVCLLVSCGGSTAPGVAPTPVPLPTPAPAPAPSACPGLPAGTLQGSIESFVTLSPDSPVGVGQYIDGRSAKGPWTAELRWTDPGLTFMVEVAPIDANGPSGFGSPVLTTARSNPTQRTVFCWTGAEATGYALRFTWQGGAAQRMALVLVYPKLF